MNHYFGIGLMALCGSAFVAAPASAQLPEWGGNEDVPTWNIGDTWEFQRDFSVGLDGIIAIEVQPGAFLYIRADLDLNFAEDFGLQVTEIATVNPNLNNSVDSLAYKRARTHGTMNVSLGGTLALFDPQSPNTDPTNVTLTLTGSAIPANTGTGENWIGVADLAQIREAFASNLTTATIQINGYGPQGDSNSICGLLPVVAPGLACGNSVSANLSVSLALDHAMTSSGLTTGGLEMIDFPTVTDAVTTAPGEMWGAHGTRRLTGSVRLVLSAFGLDETIAFDLPQDLDYLYYLKNKSVATPGGGAFTGCRFITGALTPSNDLIYYSPAAKEMPYWQLGALVVPINEGGTISGRLNMSDFVTSIASPGDVTLTAGAPITDLVISPARPAPGASFTVSGTITDGGATAVNAEVLIPGGGGSASSGSVASQSFSVNLTAPLGDDNSPMPGISAGADKGSFGIQLTHDGATSGVLKLVTVRLEAPSPLPQSAAGDWKFYE